MQRRLHGFLVSFAVAATSALAAAQGYGLPVTLAWDANRDPNVIGYHVYVGGAPSAYAETFDVGNVTSFTYGTGIAGRRYYFAVAAYAVGNIEGPLSSEVSTVIAPATGQTPSPTPPPDQNPAPSPAPGIVLAPATVNGNTVALAWRPVDLVGLVGYQVEVGSAPGASDVYNAPVGTQTSFAAQVASGSYFARIRAHLANADSVLSNEVGVTVGDSSCTTVPKTPRSVSGDIAAGVATVTWRRTAGATSYVVQIGSAPGRSNLFNGNVGTTRTLTARVAGNSSIYVRVIAINACGQSAASAEVQLQ